jgi:hypothetical protein
MPVSHLFSQSVETKISPIELLWSRSILKLEMDDFIRKCRELLVGAINSFEKKFEINK